MRDTRTSDVEHEADQEEPKIGRENFGEDTLNGKVRVTSVSKNQGRARIDAHVIRDKARNFMCGR